MTRRLALIAALFASVGQAGGAGYVGVMGLFGPRFIKPAVTPAPVISEEEQAPV